MEKPRAYHVCDDDWPVAGGTLDNIPPFSAVRTTRDVTYFRPVEDGLDAIANQFYGVMERLKMLDTLQATQLQSALLAVRRHDQRTRFRKPLRIHHGGEWQRYAR